MCPWQECQRLLGTANSGQWGKPTFQCKALVHTLLSGSRAAADATLQASARFLGLVLWMVRRACEPA